MKLSETRIAALISSDSGVTATGNPWYVQTHVQENPDQEQTIQELSEAYPGDSSTASL